MVPCFEYLLFSALLSTQFTLEKSSLQCTCPLIFLLSNNCVCLYFPHKSGMFCLQSSTFSFMFSPRSEFTLLLNCQSSLLSHVLTRPSLFSFHLSILCQSVSTQLLFHLSTVLCSKSKGSLITFWLTSSLFSTSFTFSLNTFLCTKYTATLICFHPFLPHPTIVFSLALLFPQGLHFPGENLSHVNTLSGLLIIHHLQGL